MKHTLRNKVVLTLIAFVVLYAMNIASAAWIEPSSGASSGNIESPITQLTVSQIKNGSISVGVFDAAGAAQFNQQTFLRGFIKGVQSKIDSSGNITWSDAPLRIGGTDALNNKYDVEVHSTGTVKTLKTFGAAELSAPQNERKPLCSDELGHIVFCPMPVPLPPSIKEIANTDTVVTSSGSRVRVQGFFVGPNVVPGAVYSVGVYSHEVKVVTSSTDDAKTIVDKLIQAINNTTAAQWRDTDPASAPANGTPGFPPKAGRTGNDYIYGNDPSYGSTFSIVVDFGHQFGASVQ